VTSGHFRSSMRNSPIPLDPPQIWLEPYPYTTRFFRVEYDLNLTRWCLRFNNLAPFTVFDSFSHLYLSLQCVFTLRKYRVLSLVSN
jgi:hypothetical protein